MSTVDDFIARCDEIISRPKDLDQRMLADLSSEICASFNHVIPNISRYRGMHIDGKVPPYTVNDIRKLRGKLAVYRDERNHELEVAKLNAAAAGVNVSVDNSSSSVATANATATVTVAQAIDAVDADPALSDEQKAELQNLLTQAKGAVAKGDKGLFARIGSKIMEGVEKAAPALIVKVLGFLVSQAAGL